MTRISKVFGFPVVNEPSSTSLSLLVGRGAACPSSCVWHSLGSEAGMADTAHPADLLQGLLLLGGIPGSSSRLQG